jgi:Fe-S oxidoreductase
MLDLARRQLEQILDTLRPQIRAGVPVIGVEPSCVAVFRDELPNLFPLDDDARRLREQTFTLAEYLRRIDYDPPRLERRAIVHGHCHQKSILSVEPDRELLERMGLDFEVLDSGCCGMAGAFGYEAGEKYAVSVAVGERVLLPAVRDAGPDTLILADGFSCHGQISQCTDREPLHLAEVIAMALDLNAPAGSARWGSRRGEANRRRNRVGSLAGIGAGLLAGGLLTRLAGSLTSSAGSHPSPDRAPRSR